MITDTFNADGKLVVPYEELTVLLGPDAGTAPSDSDLLENVYCSIVVQSAGSRIDYADLKYSLSESLQDRDQPASFARMVEIRFPSPDGTVIHRGDYVGEGFRIDQESESLTASSQLRPYHFGEPVSGYLVWDPIDVAERKISDHIVFNPTVDDKTLFNRSDKTRTGTGLSGYLWTHPEIADSSVGQTYQGQVREEWTLYEAVQALCELLNPDQEFIARPVSVDLDILTDAPPIRNVVIELGTRLPAALDKILIPLGYNHWIDYEQTLPQIVFFKIGTGEEKELYWPAVGAVVEPSTANVNQLAVSNSIGDSFNQVVVLGEFEEAEITLPLYPAWPEANDSIASADLSKDGTEYAANESAWRLFVANEAGDIEPTVSRLGQTPDVPVLSTVFTIATPHRRTLGEPLTWQVNANADEEKPQRRPVKVEYSIDAGTTWLPEEADWTIKLCPDQIGIYFDGKDIPVELYNAGTNGRLRITGTVFGDYRLRGFAEKQAWAVNARVNEQIIVAPEKFQSRWRQESGDYASVLTGTADERDDYDEIYDYATKVRDQNHYAEIDCEFRLPGWHKEYKIGNLITKVAGREINLDSAPSTAPANRYVQIVERRFEMSPTGGPSTVLIVDRGVVPI